MLEVDFISERKVIFDVLAVVGVCSCLVKEERENREKGRVKWSADGGSALGPLADRRLEQV